MNHEPRWKETARKRVLEACVPTKDRIWEGSTSADSERSREALQRAFVGMVMELQPSYFFTLRFEQSLRDPELRQRLAAVGAILDRHLLGKRWCHHPDRCRWIAVAEGGNHVHLLLRIPEGKELTRYAKYYRTQKHLMAFWGSCFRKKKLVVDLHVHRIPESEIHLAAGYASKKGFQREMWNADRWYLAEEFHTAAQLRSAGQRPWLPSRRGNDPVPVETRRPRPRVQ